MHVITLLVPRGRWVQRCLYTFVLCAAVVALVRLSQLTADRLLSRKITCLRCNVVILDIDVLRADALRCADNNNTITPNLCRLIRQGTSFSNAYSQTNWTLSSSLSTVTSLYPSVNGVWDMTQQGILASTTTTLATEFQRNGYQTYYLGQDNDALLTQRNGGLRGYRYIDFGSTAETSWLSAYTSALGTHQPIFFHAYTPWLHMPYLLYGNQSPIEVLPKPKGFPVYREEFEYIFRDYLLSHVTEVFMPDTIAQHPEIFQSKPLSVRGKRIVDYFRLLEFENDTTKRKYAWNVFYNSYMQFINPENPQDVAYLHMMYESTLHALDDYLGGFINYLLRPEVASHTIVVITSSHGEAFGEHGKFSHEIIPYNELYHVPFVIKYPSGPGKQVDAVVENVDLYPTLAEMVTGKVPANTQGISLVSLLSGVSIQAKSYAITMNYTDVFIIQNKRYALVVYYKYPRIKPELYDLFADPAQQHDIAFTHQDIVKQLTRLLTLTHVIPELRLSPATSPIPPSVNKKDIIRNGYF